MVRQIGSPSARRFRGLVVGEGPGITVASYAKLSPKAGQRTDSIIGSTARKREAIRKTTANADARQQPTESIDQGYTRVNAATAQATCRPVAATQNQRRNEHARVDYGFDESLAIHVDDRDQQAQPSRRKAANIPGIRDTSPATMPKTESILEKKKRMMMLHQDRLKKKFANVHEQATRDVEQTQTAATSPIHCDKETIKAQLPASFRGRCRNELSYSPSGRLITNKERRRSKSTDSQKDRRRSRPTDTSNKVEGSDVAKARLPRPERPKLRPKPPIERTKAPSHISIYETVASSGSSRQSCVDDMAAASADPLMVYEPKSPRSQKKAVQRNMEKMKTDWQPIVVYENGDHEEYTIGRVTPFAVQTHAAEVRSPSNISRTISRKLSGNLKILSPPHGIKEEAQIVGERNYTSIRPTMGAIVDSQKDLTELPSPQHRRLDFACGGSSLFSALTDAEDIADKLPIASERPTDIRDDPNIQDLVLAASSSLFSFPSTDTTDEVKAEACNPDTPASESALVNQHGQSDTQCYADLIDDEALSKLDTVATNRKGKIFSFSSAALIRREAVVSQLQSEVITPHKMCPDNDLAKDDKDDELLPHLIRNNEGTGGKKGRRVNKLFPNLFKQKRRPRQAKSEAKSDENGVGDETTIFACTHECGKDLADIKCVTRAPSDDDDDSGTMITILEPRDSEGAGGAIELLFSPTNSAACHDVDPKSLVMAKARSTSSFHLQSPRLRFPSLMSRARSAPLEGPAVIVGPIYSVRITLGYLRGVHRIGQASRTRKKCTDTALVTGFAYVDESPAIAFVSSRVAESKPITTTVNDPTSACHIVWSEKGFGDKTSGRLYLSVVQSSGGSTIPQIVNLVIGVKTARETIRLGTVSLAVEGNEAEGTLCTLCVAPDMRSDDSPSRRRSKTESRRFINDDKAEYMLGKDAMLRIRLDVKEGEPGMPGPALWGDLADDDQSFVHSLNDLNSVDAETKSASLQHTPVGNGEADEHTSSVEVVPLANGSTYIRARSAANRLSGKRLHLHPPPAIIENNCQPYGDFNFNPILEHWNCVDTILEDDVAQSVANDGISVAARSTKVETEIVIPPIISGDSELAAIPAKETKRLFGILRRRVHDSHKHRFKAPSRPAIEESSSPLQNHVSGEESGVIEPLLLLPKSPMRSVEEERTESESANGALPGRRSRDDQSVGLTTQVTSYTHSTRKSHVSRPSPAVDRAAQWLIQSFKVLVGNSSSDSDEHDRQTTFSHSTSYYPESAHDPFDSSAVTSDGTSTFSGYFGEENPQDTHIAIRELYTAISGLSDATSHDSDQLTAITKDVCEDLKKVLAIARQLNMKPDDLIERIAAGDSMDKIIRQSQL